MFPEIGLVVCRSNASNTGASKIALKIIKEHSILSLPALANKIHRRKTLAKQIKKEIVVDGCHNECAKNILNELGIKYDAYINLEYDLNIKKIGPFSTLLYSDDDVAKLKKAIEEVLGDDRNVGRYDEEKYINHIWKSKERKYRLCVQYI